MTDDNASTEITDPSAPPIDSGAEDVIEFIEPSLETGDEPTAGINLDAFNAGADDIDIEASASDEDITAPPNAASSTLIALAEKMPSGIGRHLDELRRRLIISAVAFVPAFAIGLYLYQPLWNLLLLPLANADSDLVRFQALAPSDGLILAMRIALAFALILSMPIWVGQIWSFIAPGLTSTEKRWLYLALGAGGILFFLGAMLAYLYALPLALGYLLPLNQSLTGWENSFTGDGYVGFVTTCCIAFGIAFETPLVMMVLGFVGLLTPEGIRAWWRVVVLGIFFAAAVMTPPDPFSLLLLAIPLLCLFFLGYWLVRWTGKKQA